MRPVATEGGPVSPVSGGNHDAVFHARQSDDLPITMPHPPIDEIPPMPMPEPAAPGVEANFGVGSTMTSYDAVTGEMRELPFNLSAEGALGGQSVEGDYPGFGNTVDDAIEQGRGFGVMSLAGSLDSFPRRDLR